eukprot:9444377-Pyramimonas_sp.AAC.1
MKPSMRCLRPMPICMVSVNSRLVLKKYCRSLLRMCEAVLHDCAAERHDDRMLRPSGSLKSSSSGCPSPPRRGTSPKSSGPDLSERSAPSMMQ